MTQDNGLKSLIVDSARAHVLMFESPLAPSFDRVAGARVLIAFLSVGVGLFCSLRFALDVLGVRGSSVVNLGFVSVLMATFVFVQRACIRLPFAAIGLRSFSEWTRRERLYFFQVVPIAAAAFAIVFTSHLQGLLAKHGPVGFLLYSILTGLLWGMLQEFLYRGWLQTELTRRFGVLAGLVIANVLFTFGPLHLNYFLAAEGVRWSGLIAIFGIGLLFGLVFWRSGNLWIPAIMHGLWPPNMT